MNVDLVVSWMSYAEIWQVNSFIYFLGEEGQLLTRSGD